MKTPYRKKLIEVALPLEAINAASAREKSIRHGHPSTLHLWWARRPLAAARAVLFSQLVDDPSSWLELFPTEEAQNQERHRLFRLIENLVLWENSNNEAVIDAARLEIARSHARASTSPKAKAILADRVKPAVVNEYLATELPPVHDPFAGGGTIPLEAQRLGLRAIATDLNPVAVMINKALIEIPPKFAGMPPVNPDARKGKLRTWKGAEGLAEDVRYYGAWMREEAKKRIGHLYPDVQLPKEHGGGKATVIAWLWARTVPSPNPSAQGVPVPLISSFWLAQKDGKEAWVEVAADRSRRTYSFRVQTGKPQDPQAVSMGTKLGSGNFRCVLTGDPIPAEYIRDQGQSGRLGSRMMAVVAEGSRRRVYLSPSTAQDKAAAVSVPEDAPDTALPVQALGFRVQNYGMTHHRDLFSPRQTVLLTTLAGLVREARAQAFVAAGGASELSARGDTRSLEEGGSGPAAYADAVALVLACAIGRTADFGATLCVWSPAPKNEVAMHVFGRQTLSMTWDYAEVNPFSESSGNWLGAVDWSAKAVERLWGTAPAQVMQADAATATSITDGYVVSTDPPYYDNVPYADLSDFFYIWTRRALQDRFPSLCRTVLVPKDAELIAEPFRHGGRQQAEAFFMDGMRNVLRRLRRGATPSAPATLYYAFKQAESTGEGAASTGWEAFLDAVLDAGFTLDGTWPVRTERPGRLRDTGSNALASSIVLVCRPRLDDAAVTTRGDFRRVLRKELPDALADLQQGNIAPVDVAQASIGPGMAVFSRYAKVLEADGAAMSVRSALQLINEVLDEYLASSEGDFDADTRFAITWYEQHGWENGPFGEAETLAKARNVSVRGVEEAGICKGGGGKVRILKRHELRPVDYDPAADTTPTIWEFTQHLIRYLEEEGEEAAARLLKKLGSSGDTAKELAYRLYNTCERKKWAEDARSYNGLILAWPELEKLAATLGDEAPGAAPSKAAKKAAKKPKAPKAQRDLFAGDDE